MNEKDLSELLKNADSEMIDIITENFPDDDEERKQRIFEKASEKYAQRLQDKNSSGNFEEIKIVRKDTGRVNIKYIAVAAGFAVVLFAGSMSAVTLNNDNKTAQTVYTSVTSEITSESETLCSSGNCTSEGIRATESGTNPVTEAYSSVTEISERTEAVRANQENSTPVSSVKQDETIPETAPSENSETCTVLTETVTETVTEVTEYKPEPFYWPAPGFYHVNSGFRDGINHGGIDIDEIGSASGYINGAAVYAASSGIVDACFGTCTHNECNCGGGYGNYVALKHSDDVYATYYTQLKSITVETGQYVNAGDLIGYAGNTGYSFGPHLHFEVRKNGVKTDPLSYEYIGSPEIVTEPVHAYIVEEDINED